MAAASTAQAPKLPNRQNPRLLAGRKLAFHGRHYALPVDLHDACGSRAKLGLDEVMAQKVTVMCGAQVVPSSHKECFEVIVGEDVHSSAVAELRAEGKAAHTLGELWQAEFCNATGGRSQFVAAVRTAIETGPAVLVGMQMFDPLPMVPTTSSVVPAPEQTEEDQLHLVSDHTDLFPTTEHGGDEEDENQDETEDGSGSGDISEKEVDSDEYHPESDEQGSEEYHPEHPESEEESLGADEEHEEREYEDEPEGEDEEEDEEEDMFDGSENGEEEEGAVNDILRKTLLAHAIPGANSWVAPTVLGFTNLSNEDLLAPCTVQPSQEGFGANRIDVVICLQIFRALQGHAAYTVIRSAIEAGDRVAASRASVACLQIIADEILPEIEAAWKQHFPAVNAALGWEMEAEPLSTLVKSTWTVLAKGFDAVAMAIDHPDTVSFRSEPVCDVFRTHDSIDFVLELAKGLPRLMLQMLGKHVMHADYDEVQPELDTLLKLRRLWLGGAQGGETEGALIYLLSTPYIGRLGCGMAPDSNLAGEVHAKYFGQSISPKARMLEHLRHARRGKGYCHQVGKFVDSDGRVDKDAHALIVADVDKDFAVSAVAGSWLLPHFLPVLESYTIGAGGGQRDSVEPIGIHGLLANSYITGSRKAIGLPIRATTYVGTNIRPGFERIITCYGTMAIWPSIAAALCGPQGVKVEVSAIPESPAFFPRFSVWLYGRGAMFYPGDLLEKTTWVNCWAKGGWLRFHVRVAREIPTMQPRSPKSLVLEISSSDGGPPLLLPFATACQYAGWVQNVLTRTFNIRSTGQTS